MKLSALAAGDSARESMWWPSAVWVVVLSGSGGTGLRRDQSPRQDEEAPWELCCRAAPASGLRFPLKSGDADTALGQAVMPGHSPVAWRGSSSVSVLQDEQPAGQTDPPPTGPHLGLDSPPGVSLPRGDAHRLVFLYYKGEQLLHEHPSN